MATKGSTQTIFANVKIKSVSGQSLFKAKKMVTSDNAIGYQGNTELFKPAEQILQSLGFKILHVNSIFINISGSKTLFEQVFKTRINKKRMIDENKKVYYFWDVEKSKLKGLISSANTPLEKYAEGISLCQPVEYFQIPTPSATPPNLSYYHLNVPTDISRLLNADPVHSQGTVGTGIRVIIVDSGWYHHPYYDAQNYQIPLVSLGPGADDVNTDSSGHGTGVTSNLFAIAPGASVEVIKMNLSNASGALSMAITLNPDIISCSWGWSVHQSITELSEDTISDALMVSLIIAIAVQQGICVVFAAGNGHWGFPAQLPDVIAVGGVYIDQTGNMQASDYASGFLSQLSSGDRVVPDVCGLVGLDVFNTKATGYGLGPNGMYILMPTHPHSEYDVLFCNFKVITNTATLHPLNPSATGQPYGDETLDDDGWLVASGTSSAAPQISGACALILQVKPSLGPWTIKELLMRTARDITVGHANNNTGGNQATVGYDYATGAGLVDCTKAIRALQPRFQKAYVDILRELRKRAAARAQQVGNTAPKIDLRIYDPRYDSPRTLEIIESLTPTPRVPWPINSAGFPSIRTIVHRLLFEPQSKKF